MSSIASRRRTALLGLAALTATALSAGPAFAGPAAVSCPATAHSQPFAPWQDMADYTLAPDGGLEAGGGDWSLAGGAAVVEGNEPFHVGSAGDHRSLALPAGSSATTAQMCIGREHRTIRFFARNDSAGAGSLRVEALIANPGGRSTAVHIADVRGGATWSPTKSYRAVVNRMAVAQGNTLSVSWRFKPRGGASWTIDDVYIDPFRRH